MSEALGREVVVLLTARERWGPVLGAMSLAPDWTDNWTELKDSFNSG